MPQLAGLTRLMNWLIEKLHYCAVVLLCGGLLSATYIRATSNENTLDRVQAGQWVVASMYWEDKLVSTGKAFDPIGWHAAHKTLPIGTLIRVSNPQNHRSINVTINDRGPFKPCLLYTSDAADEEDSVDLGGRRIIK